MLAATDWNAIAATAAVISVIFVMGGAAVRVSRNLLTARRAPQREIDTLKTDLSLLNIRLFGLPRDLSTGAAAVEGEFGRLDRRLNEVLAAVRNQ